MKKNISVIYCAFIASNLFAQDSTSSNVSSIINESFKTFDFFLGIVSIFVILILTLSGFFSYFNQAQNKKKIKKLKKQLKIATQNVQEAKKSSNKSFIYMCLSEASKRYNEKDFEGAMQSVERASKLDPDLPELFLYRAKILIEEKNYAEAIKVLEKNDDRFSNNLELYYTRGVAFLKQLNFEDAYSNLCKAKRILESGSQRLATSKIKCQLYNNLGYTLVRMGKIEEALNEYERAIDQDFRLNSKTHYNYAYALDEYARINKDNSYFFKAILQLKKSIKLETSYSKPYYNLACIYSILKQSDKAFTYLRHAMLLTDHDEKELFLNEADFNNIRDDKRFEELLNIFFD